MAAKFKACSEHGCNGNALGGSRGWCEKHYARWRRTGLLESSRGKSKRDRWIREHSSWSGSSCLIWPFARIPNGYGYATYNGKPCYAHRAMCEEVKGPPPTEVHVAAHSCGNGENGCVHPRHLRWATPQENTDDRYAHGTIQFGEENPGAKLSESDVREIRRLIPKHSLREIGKMYGVSTSNIFQIKKGRIWVGVA